MSIVIKIIFDEAIQIHLPDRLYSSMLLYNYLYGPNYINKRVAFVINKFNTLSLLDTDDTL